ncbi:MAG: ABC transporter substrate-binding protein [Candidatus Methanoplasma sp.]|jgi:iron complex transport system substrate-binding protein|nr:ABC transporter substrate-binding protein [Candidatus Methanoplasma sp.]
MNAKFGAVIAIAILVAAGAAAYIILKNDGDAKPIDVNLEIFGNADKDWKIDENDAKLVEDYVKAVSDADQDKISDIESRMSTRFADANNDGKIDGKDAEQIRAIANGTAKHLWFLDGIQQERDIDLDIDRIGAEYFTNTEMMLILGQSDKLVAVDNAPYMCREFYFNAEKQKSIANMVNMSVPDYDFVNGLDLDVLLIFAPLTAAKYEEKREKIVDCDVLYLGLYVPDLTNTSKSNFIQGILKAGYIFGSVERAEGYTQWVLENRDRLMETANSISDSDKPVVAMSNYTSTQYFMDETKKTFTLYRTEDPLGQAVSLAGGVNILKVLGKDGASNPSVQVDAIFNDDPNVHADFIFLHLVKYTYGGTINKGVPDHGYAVDDHTEMKAACADAGSRTLIADEIITLIAGDFRNGCTGGILLAAYMGNIINPDEYSGIDPVKMHNEYVKWMGIENYDVNEKGVFVYTGQA